MHKPTTESGIGQAHVELRRARIRATVRRPLDAASPAWEPLPPERLAFLRREAEEVYWNELSWEELTDEEVISGGRLTELVFPALLALVDGLLLDHAAPDAPSPARPHPDAVEEVLTFLGDRYINFTTDLEAGADSRKLVWTRALTAHLIDLVLFRLYRLSPTEREEVELLG